MCMMIFLKKEKSEWSKVHSDVVEVTGFEPATSASRTQHSTKLSHTSKTLTIIALFLTKVKRNFKNF